MQQDEQRSGVVKAWYGRDRRVYAQDARSQFRRYKGFWGKRMIGYSMRTAGRSTRFGVRSVGAILGVLLFLLTYSASAQTGYSFYGQAFDQTGRPAPFSTVRICSYAGGAGNPCYPLANVFSDPELTHQISNPTTTDSRGNYNVFLTGGYYIVQVTITGAGTYSYVLSATASSAQVTRIVAGNNITISPTSGIGSVTINSTGGGGGSPPDCPADGTHALTSPDGSFLCVSISGAGGLPPYRQNDQTAVIADPYGVLQNTPRPEDFCVQAKSGNYDAAPCWNTAMEFLSSNNYPTAIKTLYPSWSVNGYYFGSVNYLINLPRDFGDYHGAAGFLNPANVSTVFVNGQLISCSVTGGTRYAPNAQLPVQFTDPSYKGSGANANVATDSSGSPTGCTVTTPGMNYPPFGELAYVIPLGGDGAAATVALSGGALTGTVTVSASGSGYATGLTAAALGLTNCTVLPVLTPVVTAAQVASVTITTAGANCQIGGSSSGTVTVAFGASCGGAQCTLKAPEVPQQLGCSVALRNGVNIQGLGLGLVSIHTNYELQPSNAVSLSTTVPFCDPWGDQAIVTPANPAFPLTNSSIQISGLSVNGFIDFHFAGPVQAVKFTNMAFLGGIPMYAASVMRNNNFGTGITYTSTSITNSLMQTFTGPICCAGWSSRNPASGAGGVLGGNEMGHPNGNTPEYWGTARDFVMSDVNVDVNSSSSNQPLGTSIDQFVEQYLWKTQNGPTTPTAPGITSLLSNGSTTCPSTQTVVDRTTDFVFGQPYTSGSQFTYPYFTCFPGVAGGGVEFMPRFWQGFTPYFISNNVEFRHVNLVGSYRPALTGAFGNITVYDLYLDNGAGLTPTDPYLPSGETQHALAIYGPQVINGEVTSLTVSRTRYADALQIRQWGTVSPFSNGVALHNVWNQNDKSYALPVITPLASPSSSIFCYPGTNLGVTSAGNQYICGTDGHPRISTIGATF